MKKYIKYIPLLDVSILVIQGRMHFEPKPKVQNPDDRDFYYDEIDEENIEYLVNRGKPD